MVRLFLSAYRSETNDALDINHLGGFSASTTEYIDHFAGLDASELSQDEINYYRPRVNRDFALSRRDPVFVKIHDAYTYFGGTPLIPTQGTLGVIYLIRNPLDIVKSYANHYGMGITNAIDDMDNPELTIGTIQKDQVEQRLMTWSGHVTSWTEATPFPVMTLRYEDLLMNTHETYCSLIRFSGLPYDENRMKIALDQTQFENLRKQEQNGGFNEKPMKSVAFFRRGKVGGYRDELTQAQIRQVIDTHGPLMKRFGYIDEKGVPLF